MIEQGSSEWLTLKAGKISASNICKVMAGGQGITREKHLEKLAYERLSGQYIQEYKSADMERGNILEEEARIAYEFIHDKQVELAGFLIHPNIPNAGASPDGLIGGDGLIEIKTRDSHIQRKFVKDGKISDANMKQMQFQMAVTGRKWCDYVSYLNIPGDEEQRRIIEEKISNKVKMKVVRVERDDVKIKEIEAAVRQADAEIEKIVKELKAL